jgi:hypothetical protein
MSTKVEQFYVASGGAKRQWRYADPERPRGFCYDCRRSYESIGDCVISDGLWERINPTEHIAAGILCANCIVERLRHIGVTGVEAMLWTGLSKT